MALPENFAVVAAGGLAHVREVKELLASRGLESDYVKPPEDQGSS
jgi:hypothetical protein